MFIDFRNQTAWLSRSEKMATSTLAPDATSRPDDWVWMMARWITRWKLAVGCTSTPLVGLTIEASSFSI